MENIPQEGVGPQTELTSPPSPKRARTGCAPTAELHGSSRFDSSQLRTCRGAISRLSTGDLQKAEGPGASEGGPRHEGKPGGLASDVPPATRVTSVHVKDAQSESYGARVRAGRDENSFVAEETDEPPTPAVPDYKQLELSHEDDTPGGCGVCLQNDENRGTQTPPSLIRAADRDLCHTFSPLAGAVESNLKSEEGPFTESPPLRAAEGGSPTSLRGSQETLPLCSDVEGRDPSQKSDLQIGESVYKGENKVNENGLRKAFIEGCEFVSGGNLSVENASFEEHDRVGADLSAEVPAAAGISREPVDGETEASDPVIWSETDKEVERLLCTSDSAAGGELPPLAKVCMLETAPPLSTEVRTSQDSPSDQTEQLQDQRRTPQFGDESKIACQTEPPANSTASSDPPDQADKEGCRQWKSSPAEPPPAGHEGTEEIWDTAGTRPEEQSLSSCLAVSPDPVETQELQNSHSESDGVEEAAGIKRTETDGQAEKSEETPELVNPPGDRKSDEREGETHKHGSKLECIDGEGESLPGGACRADICVMNMTGEGEAAQKQSELLQDVSREAPGQDGSEWVENRLMLCSVEYPDQSLDCFAGDQHTPDISPLCPLPPTTDAVVPCPPQDARRSPASLKRGLGFPPPGFAPCGGFDTFEKIDLSPGDDEDDEGGLSTMPVLSSSPRQLLNTPQEQGEQQAAASETSEQPLVEGGEKESPGCPSDDTEDGYVSSASGWNEVPSSTPAADVSASALPERAPSRRSAGDFSPCSPTGLNPHTLSSAVPSERPSSSPGNSVDFEMKEQFSRVLQELSLFFEISRKEATRDCRPSSPGDSWEDDASKPAEPLSGLAGGRCALTPTDKAVEDDSLAICGVDPVVSCPVTRTDGEQEVPFNRTLDQEPSMGTGEKNKESLEAQQKVQVWSPSFMSLPHLELLSHRPPAEQRRLEPLKTCTRPIRVGLSKRAKTKQLHHVHPYE